jgi:hypothetical protein
MTENTTIKVKDSTRNALRDLGRKGDTYDKLISDLVKASKSKTEGGA